MLILNNQSPLAVVWILSAPEVRTAALPMDTPSLAQRSARGRCSGSVPVAERRRGLCTRAGRRCRGRVQGLWRPCSGYSASGVTRPSVCLVCTLGGVTVPASEGVVLMEFTSNGAWRSYYSIPVCAIYTVGDTQENAQIGPEVLTPPCHKLSFSGEA